jgi:hypothetical protein
MIISESEMDLIVRFLDLGRIDQDPIGSMRIHQEPIGSTGSMRIHEDPGI